MESKVIISLICLVFAGCAANTTQEQQSTTTYAPDKENDTVQLEMNGNKNEESTLQKESEEPITAEEDETKPKWLIKEGLAFEDEADYLDWKRRQAERSRQNQTYQSNQHLKWYEGGTLRNATMKEWSQASYRNKLATVSDFATYFLIKNGVAVVTPQDIETKVKPLAIDLVKGLDAANKDGIMDNQTVIEVTSAIFVMMQRNY